MMEKLNNLINSLMNHLLNNTAKRDYYSGADKLTYCAFFDKSTNLAQK